MNNKNKEYTIKLDNKPKNEIKMVFYPGCETAKS